jgi:N-acetylmuramoyl-L-alanine amidase
MNISGKKIFIDPGHGGTSAQGIARCGKYQVGTSGALSGNEKSSVLEIGMELKGTLEAYGATVEISRTTDTPLCLGERANLANDWGADVFISLHHNGSTDKTVNGISAHWYKTEDKALAAKMAPRIKEYTGLNTWGTTGVRYQDLQVLRDTEMPATLLELGFMSNAGDDAFIAEYEGKLDFINGIVMGLEDYFA